MKKTAVVILNWNGRALMKQFLPFLLANTPEEEAEIVVADNGSSDGSLQFLEENYPGIRRIVFEKNLGFAEGYNQALALLDHEYVVLLNSDIEVTPGWLTTAVNYLDAHSDVVALQPKILSQKNKNYFEYAGAAGGFMDIYGYPYCRGRILHVVEEDMHQYDTPVEVLWASGACLFIRLQTYKDCGGLDSYFFAHQEEIDMCWRLVSRGMKIVCLPSSVVFHVGGATLAMEHPHKTFLNFRNNLLMIYKNMSDKQIKKVLIIRFFLDYLAALHLLLKGYPKNAIAVFRARIEFHRTKKNYKNMRRENLRLSVPGLPSTITHRSLIISFYLKGKKTFTQYDS